MQPDILVKEQFKPQENNINEYRVDTSTNNVGLMNHQAQIVRPNNQTYQTGQIQPEPVNGRFVNNLVYPNNNQYINQAQRTQAMQPLQNQQTGYQQPMQNAQPIMYQQPVIQTEQ